MSQTSLTENAEAKTSRRISRGARRRLEIAAVAEQVFSEYGYAEATMQMIASRAGASKETLYRHFVSKEDLFGEIVRARLARFWGPSGIVDNRRPPVRILTDLGNEILRMLATPYSFSLLSMVITEAKRTPELGTIFYEQGPKMLLRHLTLYLRTARARGEIRCSDTPRAAKLFIGAVFSTYHLSCLLTPGAIPNDEADMRAHVAAAVTMFMARYGAPERG